jgi:hypothetical protein
MPPRPAHPLGIAAVWRRGNFGPCTCNPLVHQGRSVIRLEQICVDVALVFGNCGVLLSILATLNRRMDLSGERSLDDPLVEMTGLSADPLFRPAPYGKEDFSSFGWRCHRLSNVCLTIFGIFFALFAVITSVNDPKAFEQPNPPLWSKWWVPLVAIGVMTGAALLYSRFLSRRR